MKMVGQVVAGRKRGLYAPDGEEEEDEHEESTASWVPEMARMPPMPESLRA